MKQCDGNSGVCLRRNRNSPVSGTLRTVPRPIAKAEQFSPDLIILDLARPEMSGLEAAGALRFIVPDATVFLLTAYKNRELELACGSSLEYTRCSRNMTI